VAHHGSRTSTSQALLYAWQPHVALVSCGRGNRFGHPAPDVIRRLEAAGARIYRTDRDGQITIETDGRHLSIRTYLGGRQ
jgi:competence protein ComEC